MAGVQRIASGYAIYVNGDMLPLSVNSNNKTWEGSATYGAGTYTISDGKVIWDDDGGYLQYNGTYVLPTDEIINGGQYTTSAGGTTTTVQCTVTTSGTGFTVDISPTDNCTVANGVVTATDETAQASFSVEFFAAVGYKITDIDWTCSSDVNVTVDGNSFAVNFNGSDPGSVSANTLAFTVTTTEGNIEINITSNGTTTLATAGKLCNRNIAVITDVPTSGGGGGTIAVQVKAKKADAARNIAVNMSTINVEMTKEGE